MNKGKLKNYAPRARREFIQAVTDRAHFYGLSKNKTIPIEEKGDYVFIQGNAFAKHVKIQRQALENRIADSNYDHVMEEIAYTWFNRFVAIRYMELHGYLSHGYRVLSHPDPETSIPETSIPEILEKAQHVDIPKLNKERVIELKMDGTKDEELYRILLIAQCNELNQAMPFLFEPIRDCTELLLPDNLLHSDSLIRKLVNEIDEADWQEVEIIGWMYQFYISEKKDEVIGNVVKSEDIPAATQLFTPNWIVKYLVQNSLGSQWMRTYPDSPLKGKMEYYIEPAEQTQEVQKQLAEITPDSLNPEELTLLDPACGSGHILVEGYNLLKEIYLERGYRKRDIPELILKKNLFGLEIDDRASQLAGFAVIMKARADDRGFFEKKIQPQIISIQESYGLDVEEIVRAINAPLTEKEVAQSPASLEELQTAVETPLFISPSRKKEIILDDEEKLTVDDLKSLLGLFEHGKTFGSLIRIPEKLVEKLPAMAERVQRASQSGQPFAQAQAIRVKPFIQQALIMSEHYDAVVANPPYMGPKAMNQRLKIYSRSFFESGKTDLFAMFIRRGFELSKCNTGYNAMVAMHSWMFLSSFLDLRMQILNDKTIISIAHLGPKAFSAITGEVVSVAAFSIINAHSGKFKPTILRLIDGNEKNKMEGLKEKRNIYNNLTQEDFSKIPNSPIAYWAAKILFDHFMKEKCIDDISPPRIGMMTTDNQRFLRSWYEICFSMIGFGYKKTEEATNSNTKWFPYNKGGSFKRWYGNQDLVVNWYKGGQEISDSGMSSFRGKEFYFKQGITWSDISTGNFACRYTDNGFIFDIKGTSSFPDEEYIEVVMALLNSIIGSYVLKFLNPTMTYQSGDIRRIPFVENKLLTHVDKIKAVVREAISLSQMDWNSLETSWNYSQSPLVIQQSLNVNNAFNGYQQNCKDITIKLKEIEERNNRLFIDAYGLQDELTPDVPDDQITLFANPKYRYGANLSDEELENRFKEDTIKELISYSVGCMMGRYSLDEPGLIYAHEGNKNFVPAKYTKFPADNDGIIPITDISWFDDDAAERFFKFIETVWREQTLEDNLDFTAEAIGRKTSESSRDCIRRFFCNDFFKDHLKRYKKRPIYWLFSSGKEKAFQCLVYLHRYNEGTLSRIRTEYLIPLQGMIRQQVEHLKEDEKRAESSSAKSKISKKLHELDKQAEELRVYDEQLHHYADLKIKLDLDDGVKVNYGKFGDLLAEVKAITGAKED